MVQQIADAAREEHIAACGRLMVKAMQEGDRAAAQQWLKLQNEAIAARSPAQIQRMEQDYFGAQGEQSLVEHQQRMVGNA